MKSILLCTLVGLFVVLLVGCSSNGGSSLTSGASKRTGAVHIAVKWPARGKKSRYIPLDANSLTVTLTGPGEFSASQVLGRPAAGTDSTADFSAVPVGSVSVSVAAFESTDGGGVAQASANATATVTNHSTADVSIDLTSTITSVSVAFPDIINSANIMAGDPSFPVVTTANDAASSIVPVRPQPNGFYYTTSDATIAIVDQSGSVTPVAPGTATITAMESETGITGQLTVNVLPATGSLHVAVHNTPITVAVSPLNPTVGTYNTLPFTATVTGVPNTAVIWSVIDTGLTYSSIDQNGTFMGGMNPGTCTVKAVSIANQAMSATTTVTITGGY